MQRWMWVGKADFLSISEDMLSIYSTLFCFPSRNWLQDHYHLVGRQKGQAGTLVSFDFELLWLWAHYWWAGQLVLPVGCCTKVWRAQSSPSQGVRLASSSYQSVILANQTPLHSWAAQAACYLLPEWSNVGLPLSYLTVFPCRSQSLGEW